MFHTFQRKTEESRVGLTSSQQTNHRLQDSHHNTTYHRVRVQETWVCRFVSSSTPFVLSIIVIDEILQVNVLHLQAVIPTTRVTARPTPAEGSVPAVRHMQGDVTAGVSALPAASLTAVRFVTLPPVTAGGYT